MKLTYLKSVLLLLISSSAVAAHAQTKDSIDLFLEAKMQEEHIPGLQLAVVQHGKIVKTGNYGLANVEHNVATNAESVFNINSITKAFVGVAIMQLQEAGKLNVQDPISRYIDSLPAAWQGITLKQILTNTSGLPNITDPSEHVLGDGTEQAAWKAVQKIPMQFNPGEHFSYNQTGYVILGMIINKLSGEHFTKFIQDRQFNVAEMKQTRFGDSYDIIPHYAGAYSYLQNINGQWIKKDIQRNAYIDFPIFFRTATGILSTATEMANWIIALQNGKLLKDKASLTTLWTPGLLNNGKIGGFNSLTNGYALGWPTVTRQEHPAVGPVGGGRSAFFLYLKDDLTIIVLTNLLASNPEGFIDEIAGYYHPDMKESNGFGFSPGIKKLRIELLRQGFDKAEKIALSLKKKDPAIRFEENDINGWGYKLIGQDKKEEALAIFKLNVKLYPQSFNTYDSLGEIMEALGDRAGAIKNYSRSLELNPKNDNAVHHLKNLKA
ncbi:MAG: hypothetical protein JWR38_1594 [Mucilaginibacter sp.]|nr:hypothetical protein [Mucilaginibacter sp.]